MCKSKDSTKTAWETNAYSWAFGGVCGGRAEVPLLTPQYFCPRSKRVEVPGDSDIRSHEWRMQDTWNIGGAKTPCVLCAFTSLTFYCSVVISLVTEKNHGHSNITGYIRLCNSSDGGLRIGESWGMMEQLRGYPPNYAVQPTRDSMSKWDLKVIICWNYCLLSWNSSTKKRWIIEGKKQQWMPSPFCCEITGPKKHWHCIPRNLNPDFCWWSPAF